MELVVVLRGEAIHVCSAGQDRLSKGTALMLRPGTWHAYRQCIDLDVVNFCFPLSMARSDGRHLLDERVRSVLRSGEGLQITQLSDLATECLDQLERVERNSTGALGLMIWALDQFASTVPIKRSLHPAVERAVCELEEQSSRSWTSESLAKAVGLDKA